MAKTVVITGGNSGIGLAMAQEVAARGERVIMACRNLSKAEAARADILRCTPGAEIEIASLDLASFEHIRRFVDALGGRPVDALINNAGACPSRQQFTAEGFELQFGANYLGPFLLTHLMIPNLSAAAAANSEARIVHVASVAHNVGRIDPRTFRGRSRYLPLSAYAQSKLGNLMFHYALTRRLPREISTHAMHPGGVDSGMYRDLPRPAYAVIRAFLIAPERAGRLGADLALSPEYRSRSGGYHTTQRPNPVSRRARDTAQQESLYAESAALAGIEPLPTC